MEEADGVDAFKTGRDAVDGEGVASEVGEVEAYGREAGKNLLEDDRLGRCETDGLREEHLLGGGSMVLELLQITLVTDAHIGTMLVDDHESGLDGCHDVTALVLRVQRREISFGGWKEIAFRGLKVEGGGWKEITFGGTGNVVELLPVGG